MNEKKPPLLYLSACLVKEDLRHLLQSCPTTLAGEQASPDEKYFMVRVTFSRLKILCESGGFVRVLADLQGAGSVYDDHTQTRRSKYHGILSSFEITVSLFPSNNSSPAAPKTVPPNSHQNGQRNGAREPKLVQWYRKATRAYGTVCPPKTDGEL